MPISAEIVRHVFDRAAMTADLLGRPPAGTVRHRQARRRDCGHILRPRPHRTRPLWTQPAVLAPHQTCAASETRKVHQHHDRAILHPHPTPATAAARPRRRGLDMHPQQAGVFDAEHVHSRQANQQLAHARRVQFHEGSPF